MATNWKPYLDRSAGPVYQAIVSSLSSDIETGSLSADTKLPTHRELADTLGVAIGTVTRAYAEAERRGLIRSEGRRGTFVGEPHAGGSALARLAQGPGVGIDLSRNHPFYGLDPDLSAALREIARRPGAQSLLQYPPAAGLPSHREVGAAWLRSLGAKAEADSVFITTGVQHALSVILTTETKPGETIATEDFTYPGITSIAELLGLQVAGIPMDADGILPDAFEAACRRRRIRLLYCNPSLHNPTNSICPLARRKEIAAVAAKHGVAILEDEIMRPLLEDHPGYIADILPEQTFLTISVSKAVAAGLRLGFILAPPRARQRLSAGLNASCLGVAPLPAEIFSVWMADGTVDAIIARRREDTAARQQLAAEVLDGFVFKQHPRSYHIWLELPEGWTSMRLLQEAQLRGASVAPAEAFAVDGKATVQAVRLSVVVTPTMEMLRSGLQTVAGLLRGSAGHHLVTV